MELIGAHDLRLKVLAWWIEPPAAPGSRRSRAFACGSSPGGAGAGAQPRAALLRGAVAAGACETGGHLVCDGEVDALSPDIGSLSPFLFGALHQQKLVEVFYFDSTGGDRFAFARR